MNEMIQDPIQNSWIHPPEYRACEEARGKIPPVCPGMIMEIKENLLEQDIEGFFWRLEILNMLLHRTFDDGNAAEELTGTFQDPGHVRGFSSSPAPPHALEE
jgi:hypothetical protein